MFKKMKAARKAAKALAAKKAATQAVIAAHALTTRW